MVIVLTNQQAVFAFFFRVFLKGTVVWSSCYGHFVFQPCSKNFLFFSILGRSIFTTWKLRAFERNPCFWNRYSMPKNPITFMTMLKNFTSLFHNKYGGKWNERTTSCICGHFWSINYKAMNQSILSFRPPFKITTQKVK